MKPGNPPARNTRVWCQFLQRPVALRDKEWEDGFAICVEYSQPPLYRGGFLFMEEEKL
ncbi:hypothetical protein SAMN06264849_11072 [Melghirimyces algeriensis]|uniref:Uncharacterized protein n=1 Tax=Melghirimyces algeriensis TaxID=910412 RepID=A0A521ESU5_9BACL|nr:hypothetical protein SAMN06264849_11072 [Melghirimyces algeriensis]